MPYECNSHGFLYKFHCHLKSHPWRVKLTFTISLDPKAHFYTWKFPPIDLDFPISYAAAASVQNTPWNAAGGTSRNWILRSVLGCRGRGEVRKSFSTGTEVLYWIQAIIWYQSDLNEYLGDSLKTYERSNYKISCDSSQAWTSLNFCIWYQNNKS